ncbi:MAG: hypothetical protein ACE5FT_02695 [Candidatus Nanoarchaeia archaeon]
MKFPQIKKKANAFLVGEDAKISKESVIKVGAILSAMAISGALASKKVQGQMCHTNSASFPAHGSAVHSHHSQHCSY